MQNVGCLSINRPFNPLNCAAHNWLSFMTNCSSSVHPNTLMTYEHPWYTQQQQLANITTCESESTQKPAKEAVGQTRIEPNALGDLYEYIVIIEAIKRGAHVYKNVGCTGKTDLILEKDGDRIPIDVKASSTHKSAATGVFLVHVDVDTHQVRWGVKKRKPEGWESFWNQSTHV